MSYTLNQDGTVTLDSGELVAVTIDRERLENGGGTVFSASATWIDNTGAPKTDGTGIVASATTFNADAAVIAANGEDALARALLLTVLGEDQSVIPFSSDFKGNVSIRAHIASAQAPAPDPMTLLG